MSETANRLRMQLNRDKGLAELDKVVQKYGVVNGRPFTFKDHEFQIEIIRDTRSRLAVRKCSQVGLSELMVQKTLAMTAVMQHIRIIFTLPTRDFAMAFSKDRFDTAIESSDFYSGLIKKANDSASQKKIGTNTLYIGGSFGSNSAISVPAEVVINDEVDFSNEAVLGKLSSRLRHASIVDERGYRGLRAKFSTPTVHDYGIDGDFEKGHQAYYMCKCRYCANWVLPDFFHDFVIPGYDGDNSQLQKGDLRNPTYRFSQSKILCPSCRSDLWSSLMDPERRQWVAKKPDNWEHSYQVFPWDAPVYNTPESVITQLGDYPLISDFYNFVIGIPHSDANNTFNTEQGFKERVSDVVMWQLDRVMTTAVTTAGMDVGKICHLTVTVRIGAHDSPRKVSHVVYAEKIHNTRENPAAPEVVAVVDAFRVAKMCIDAGPDITLVNTLLSAKQQISAVVYVRSIKGPTWFEEKDSGAIINVDRTKALTELLAAHNAGEIHYPNRQDIRDDIFNHLKTTKKIRERGSDGDMVEKFIKTSDEDHWVHSLNYARIAEAVMGETGYRGVVGVLPGVSTVRMK